MADTSVGEKRKAEETVAEETTEVGEKRKNDTTSSNPKKKRKFKRVHFDPCVIRRKIQEFFKDKSTEDSAQVEAFLKTCEVSKFSDFHFQQRTFYEFIKEHNVEWKNGEIVGPTQEWLESKLREQMHFYFSDANLPRDTFLLNEIAKSEGRWVKLSVFKKFKLVMKWSDKEEDLVNALSKSNKLELDETKTSVRRKEKCVASKWDIDWRTTKVHGFRFAKGKANAAQMKEFFEQWGVVDAVFPRKPKKGFVGSLEVIWADAKTAAAFREQQTVKYQDDELSIKQEVASANFELVFKFGNSDLRYKELKQWLRDLGIEPKRVESSSGQTYVWADKKFAEVSEALAKAEDSKKYGEVSAIEQAEFDQVFKLFNGFTKLDKRQKFRKQKKYKQNKE